MKKILLVLLLVSAKVFGQQSFSIPRILDSIDASNPVAKMYDADIRSMDEAAKGARSWMPPEAGAGFFMTPYDPKRWSKMSDGEEGMGSFMVSVQQMFPSRKKLDADEAYMKSMSATAAENKKAALNDLYAQAKKAYYEWLIIEKKKTVLDENEKILEFMIKNAEIRYRNGLEKINAYYKTKAALGNIQSMRLMLENEIQQKKIILNTLMYRDAGLTFTIDTSISLNVTSVFNVDTEQYRNRSVIRSIDRQVLTNQLKQRSERMSLRPQFGLRFEHMIGFGGQPQQFTLMGMVKLPFVPWASRMTKANLESYKWQNEALISQRDMLLNEASGMAAGMRAEIEVKAKQVKLYENNIIPALRNNYKTMLLAYEQNTEELFMVFDAWESLNMTQNDHLDQLQQLLLMRIELERVLELRK
jgi:outer membrane protein TolC